jgi:hypothetical protein
LANLHIGNQGIHQALLGKDLSYHLGHEANRAASDIGGRANAGDHGSPKQFLCLWANLLYKGAGC